MNAPSKPVIIAIAGVAGLVVVIGGVVWLRSRALPQDVSLLTSTAETIPAERSPVVTSTVVTNQGIATSTTGGAGDGGVIVQDTDGDGLTDEEESRIGTSTTLRDTDGDGSIDYEEVRVMHTDPLFFNTQTVTLVASPPENPTESPSNPVVDSDNDGLTDQDEVRYQTNPSVADTDGDGYLDGAEIEKGYNPRGSGKCATSTCLP